MAFWGILGGACLLYYIIICIYAGMASAFSWFWVLSGITGVALGILWKRIPGSFQKGIWGLFIAGLAVLVVLEGKILYCANKPPQKEADYLIVLGCQVRGTRITRSLKYRLEAAYEYAEENKDTKIIVSGGQGFGEDISEAEAMKGWLVEKGIESERIYMEDKSTNTHENMKFSRELIEKQMAEKMSKAAEETGTIGDKTQTQEAEYKTVVVSNGFHLYRALKLGEKQGFERLEGLGAKTDRILAVSYYVREAFALLKDTIVGNI